MITYKKGNLLDATERYIGHGCNCQGIMGSGVALAIKNKWPKVAEADRRRFLAGNVLLGEPDYVIVGTNPLKVVVNFYTQPRPGPCASLSAIETGLFEFFYGQDEGEPVSLALPRIGCGLGGLRWNDVEAAINRAIKRIFDETGIEHNVVIYDLE